MKDYEKTSSISKLISETMQSIKGISDSSTIFGDPVMLSDGTTIIPVSKLTVGFVIGGGEYSDLSMRRVGVHYPMAGGSGGGLSMMPIGFIVNSPTEVKFIPTANNATIEAFLEKIMKTAEFVKDKIDDKLKK